MPRIRRLTALEILDSRGRPTLQATCELEGGICGSASVPAGASTGTAEAVELRDGDPRRFRGLGCRRAVACIEGEIQRALSGLSFDRQEEVDTRLLNLDGTADKSRLGANTLLAVSLAFSRAAARHQGIPLYQYYAQLLSSSPQRLPQPTINLFSGGKHAGNQVAVQDLLLVPQSAPSLEECLRMAFDVYQSAAELVEKRYGSRPLVADEGGLAPPFPASQAMLEDALLAIEAAGLQPGRDISLALDVASTHFYRQGSYHLDGEILTSSQMIDRLLGWLEQYPVVSVEDGLAEEDWEHWPRLREEARGRALIVADDLTCTQPSRLRRAVELRAADTLLLKVNQVGTLTEAAQACRLARQAGWQVAVSARSGETEDDWLADLAVGWSADQIKIGSLTRSERLAKYNRLLAMEASEGFLLQTWRRPLS